MSDIIKGEALGPRVTSATATDDYRIFLTFTTGEKRVFNAAPLLETIAFKSLANKAFFQSVKVAYGSVSWPNDIDYCPDTLYMESVPAE
ncbi:MAG: DUF2442 domain-containing protein [Defluviitaleaceae bacterium]|nr:DUF2442 domain-containing protein [Defluviitaleaceae bacterium]